MVGLLAIARQARIPIAPYEVRASAGLHLARFGYSFAGLALGNPTSGVQIAPDWQGDLPSHALVTVTSLRGTDLAPPVG